MELPESERKRLIRLIHVAKTQLKLSDDQYRAVLEGATGKNSCSDMTALEIKHAYDAMLKLGFKPGPAKNAAKAKSPQLSKLRAQWIELHGLGLVKDRSDAGLLKFCKRLTGVDRLEWLTSAQASKAIEGLKAMRQRAGGGQ
jgi:phage gp16-like protein